MFTQDDLSKLTKSLVTRLPHIEPFLFVIPMRVLSPEEYQAKIPAHLPQTAACTSTEFLFQSEFIAQAPAPQQRGLILHEILHGALEHLSHPWRDKTITEESFFRLRNIAQDVVVENFVAELSEADQPGVKPADRYIQNFMPLPDSYAKYKGWNWRDVYEDLRSQADVQPNDSFDHHGYGDDNTPEAAQARAEAERLWKSAQKASEAARQALAGNAPGIDNIAITAAAEKVRWQDTLADFLQSIPSPERKTWTKVRRRPFCTRQEYRPSKTGEQPALDHVYLFVDTSGSMHGTLATVAADILGLMRAVQVSTLEIVYYDVGVQRRDVIDFDDMEGYTITSMPGGGGTAVRPAMEEVVGSPDYVQGAPFVVLTDGYDDYNIGSLPTGPLVWLSYEKPVNSDRGVSLLVK